MLPSLCTRAFCSGFLGRYSPVSPRIMVYSQGERSLLPASGSLSSSTPRERVRRCRVDRRVVLPVHELYTGCTYPGIPTRAYREVHTQGYLPGHTGRYIPTRVREAIPTRVREAIPTRVYLRCTIPTRVYLRCTIPTRVAGRHIYHPGSREAYIPPG